MFLLDTNVVREIRKAASGRADPHVLRWARAVPPPRMFISVITVQELEIDILLVERRDPAQGGLLRAWLETQVLPGFADRILNVDVTVARKSAALHTPDPRPIRDGLIAATGLVHGLTVVTRNVRDFEPMGVELLNPWDDPLAT